MTTTAVLLLGNGGCCRRVAVGLGSDGGVIGSDLSGGGRRCGQDLKYYTAIVSIVVLFLCDELPADIIDSHSHRFIKMSFSSCILIRCFALSLGIDQEM